MPARPPARWPAGPPPGGRTGLAAGWLARRLPAVSDQGIELGPHQIVIAEHEVNEDPGLVECLLLDRSHRSHPIDNVPPPSGVRRPGQASICLRSAAAFAIAILRGLACSATGILNVSTPAS